MIEKRVAVCQSKNETNHWVELLRKHMPKCGRSEKDKGSPVQVQYVPQPPPHVSV